MQIRHKKKKKGRTFQDQWKKKYKSIDYRKKKKVNKVFCLYCFDASENNLSLNINNKFETHYKLLLKKDFVC